MSAYAPARGATEVGWRTTCASQWTVATGGDDRPWASKTTSTAALTLEVALPAGARSLSQPSGQRLPALPRGRNSLWAAKEVRQLEATILFDFESC